MLLVFKRGQRAAHAVRYLIVRTAPAVEAVPIVEFKKTLEKPLRPIGFRVG